MAKELVRLFLYFWVAVFMWLRYHLYHFFKNLFFWRKHKLRTPVPKGHRIYSFDLKKLELTRQDAVETKAVTRIRNKNYKVKDFKIKRGCIAIMALNDKNAIKQARKSLKQRGYEQPEETAINIRKVPTAINA